MRLFASNLLPPTSEELGALQQLAALDDVRAVVALPDLHIKPRLETPSSTAIATRSQVMLSLSSPSPGCGMALARTSLHLSDLDDARLEQLFTVLAAELPLRPWRAPAGRAFSIDRDQAERMLLEGAPAAVSHFDLPTETLDAIDGGGNALDWLLAASADLFGGDGSLPGSSQQVLDALPPGMLPLAAGDFGTIGRGNHFLELQVVERLLDPSLAAQWGLHPGQVVVMYHADSGRLGALLGRVYAFRRKNTWRGRWIELRTKLPFHLRRAHSLPAAWRRIRRSLLPASHVPLPLDAPETADALRALAVATNYAFANRLAIFAALRAGLQRIWGPTADAGLLYDLSHNSIRPEVIDGQSFWVHRHNASRALPPAHSDLSAPYAASGQPVLLPGTARTASYLCVAGPATAESLYSIDHGAGRSAIRLGLAQGEPNTTTNRYNYEQGLVARMPHYSSTGVEAVLQVLMDTGLVNPVVRLRPIAVLKDGGQ